MNSTMLKVFDWNVQYAQLADGMETSVVVREDSKSELSENWTLWSVGERDLVQYPEGFDDAAITQRRGKFVAKQDLAGHTYKRGRYTVKAVGDAEFWCVNSALNDNLLPGLNATFLSAGQTYSSKVGDLLLLAAGQASVGAAPMQMEVVTDGLVITAITDAVLVKFSGRKNAV